MIKAQLYLRGRKVVAEDDEKSSGYKWASLNVVIAFLWISVFRNGFIRCSVQFSSVAQSCLTLCHPMDCSMPGFTVHHQLPELALTHVHQVCDAIQSSHPLLSPSLAFNFSQHQGLFKWVSFSHQVAKVLEFQLQHQSFQWILRIDFLQNWLIWSPCCPRDSQESSPAL